MNLLRNFSQNKKATATNIGAIAFAVILLHRVTKSDGFCVSLYGSGSGVPLPVSEHVAAACLMTALLNIHRIIREPLIVFEDLIQVGILILRESDMCSYTKDDIIRFVIFDYLVRDIVSDLLLNCHACRIIDKQGECTEIAGAGGELNPVVSVYPAVPEGV